MTLPTYQLGIMNTYAHIDYNCFLRIAKKIDDTLKAADPAMDGSVHALLMPRTQSTNLYPLGLENSQGLVTSALNSFSGSIWRNSSKVSYLAKTNSATLALSRQANVPRLILLYAHALPDNALDLIKPHFKLDSLAQRTLNQKELSDLSDLLALGKWEEDIPHTKRYNRRFRV